MPCFGFSFLAHPWFGRFWLWQCVPIKMWLSCQHSIGDLGSDLLLAGGLLVDSLRQLFRKWIPAFFTFLVACVSYTFLGIQPSSVGLLGMWCRSVNFSDTTGCVPGNEALFLMYLALTRRLQIGSWILSSVVWSGSGALFFAPKLSIVFVVHDALTLHLLAWHNGSRGISEV